MDQTARPSAAEAEPDAGPDGRLRRAARANHRRSEGPPWRVLSQAVGRRIGQDRLGDRRGASARDRNGHDRPACRGRRVGPVVCPGRFPARQGGRGPPVGRRLPASVRLSGSLRSRSPGGAAGDRSAPRDDRRARAGPGLPHSPGEAAGGQVPGRRPGRRVRHSGRRGRGGDRPGPRSRIRPHREAADGSPAIGKSRCCCAAPAPTAR